MADWIFEKYQRPITVFKLVLNQLGFLLRLNYAPHLLGASIDIISRCNLSCKMCRGASIVLNNKNEIMLLPEIKSILSRLPRSVESVLLSNTGEPLLHPDLLEIIELTRHYGFRPVIFTNGTLLTDEISTKLLRSPLDSLNVSIETDNANCIEMRGIALAPLEEKVLKLIKLKKELGSKVKINLSLVLHKGNTKSFRPFLTKWEDKVDEIKVSPWGLYRKTNPGICNELWKGTLFIRTNGTVVPCCADVLGEIPVGQISQSDPQKIWNGPIIHIIRASVLRNQFPKRCYFCSYEECQGIGRTKKIS